jgi:LacI family transcriptional regulator
MSTLKQVALQAGVSHQTVWRSLTGAPGVSEETRAAVLHAAAQLKYRRNRIAGSLRTNQSSTIGLVVLDVTKSHAGEIARGVEEQAVTLGFSVLLANSGGNSKTEQAAVQMLLEHRVDGIILWPSEFGTQDYLRGLLPAKFPIVAINRKATSFACPSVLSRDEDAAEAARYLLNLGHRAIGGIFGHADIAPFKGRLKAFSDEIEKHGHPVRRKWIKNGENTPDFGYRATLEIFGGSPRPTALFTAGSQLTEGALRGLKEMGIRHGRDVALIGYDLRYAQLLDPPVPVLMQPAREMGRLALTMIVEKIRKRAIAGPALRRLPVDIQTS